MTSPTQITYFMYPMKSVWCDLTYPNNILYVSNAASPRHTKHCWIQTRKQHPALISSTTQITYFMYPWNLFGVIIPNNILYAKARWLIFNIKSTIQPCTPPPYSTMQFFCSSMSSISSSSNTKHCWINSKTTSCTDFIPVSGNIWYPLTLPCSSSVVLW